MRQIPLTICLLLISLTIQAQGLRELGIKPVWREGNIQLKDNTTLKGLVYYNTSFGTIQFKSIEEAEVISFQENRVLTMNFFDQQLNRTKNYTAITYTDTATDRQHQSLFEVIKDFGDFAVLSRISKAAQLYPSNYNNEYINTLHDFGVPDDKMYIQIEGIFFVDKRRKLALYSLIKDMDYDGLLYDYSKSKSKIIKSKVLRDYTKNHWDDLQVYIKENKLKPKLKSDLIRILDHYEHLIASKNND